MTTKIYAIYSNNPDDRMLIVSTWDKCKSLTYKQKGKLYKSFPINKKREVALWFLEKINKEDDIVKNQREKELREKLRLDKEEIIYLYSLLEENNNNHKEEDYTKLQNYLDEIEKNDYVAYVDGSYNIKTKEYSYGLCVVFNGKIVFEDAKKYIDKNNMRQINGELKAAIIACNFAINNKIKKLYIVHDYQGVSDFATQKWGTKKEDIEFYVKIMQRNMKNINIEFVKVPAHKKFVYNEKADFLAKEVLGIKK